VTWFGIVFVAYLVVTALAVTFLIGKPREPISPGGAAITLIVNALLVWGALTIGTLHR
jgi:uncharacterized membrane protein required for colicin V production